MRVAVGSPQRDTSSVLKNGKEQTAQKGPDARQARKPASGGVLLGYVGASG